MAAAQWKEFWAIQRLIIHIIAFIMFLGVSLFTTFECMGSSMEPSLHSRDYLLGSRLIYHITKPRRGDIITFKDPLSRAGQPILLIKR